MGAVDGLRDIGHGELAGFKAQIDGEFAALLEADIALDDLAEAGASSDGHVTGLPGAS